MYKEISELLEDKFKETELDFHEQYIIACGRVAHYRDADIEKNAIIRILSQVLLEYSISNPRYRLKIKLKRIGNYFSQILKLIKLKQKKWRKTFH
jgi:hypothetical protein